MRLTRQVRRSKMSRPAQQIVKLFALATAFATVGCGATFYRVADSEAPNYMKVVKVTGRDVVLEDGRIFRVAGLNYDDDKLPNDIRSGLDSLLGILKHCEGVTVKPTGQNGLAIITWTLWAPNEHFETIHILPARIPEYPRHIDLAETVLSDGLARSALNEVADSDIKNRYVLAERSAQKSRLGLWGKQ